MNDLIDLPFTIIFARLFTFRPKVYWDGKLLVAKSDWKSQIFCLGIAGRKVVVDPISKIVRINRRFLWVFHKTRRIEFGWIAEINYNYTDLNPQFTVFDRPRQQQDLFKVGLILKTGERVKLFSFFGRGGWVNDTSIPDWFYYEDRLEADFTKQDQQGESLGYADMLKRLIDVPIANRY